MNAYYLMAQFSEWQEWLVGDRCRAFGGGREAGKAIVASIGRIVPDKQALLLAHPPARVKTITPHHPSLTFHSFI